MESITSGRAEADETLDILTLFEEVFGNRRPPERWAWQYHASPTGQGIVTVSRQGGRIVGCVTLMRQDLNSLGERIPAAQACDGMLSPSARGGGVFGELSRRSYELGAEAGLQVVIGFPNHNSFPPLLRTAGHRRVLVLKHYYRRTGLARAAGESADRIARPAWNLPNRLGLSMLRRRLNREFRRVCTPEVPADLERLLADHRRLQVLGVWKDSQYLRWRYQDHPEHSYHFHTLRHGDRPVALAVVHRHGDVAAICEFINPAQDVRQAARLLRGLVSHYSRDRGCQLVEFFGSDISFFDAAFAEAGFRRSTHSNFVLIARALGPGMSERADVHHPWDWTLSYGDTDVI